MVTVVVTVVATMVELMTITTMRGVEGPSPLASIAAVKKAVKGR